MNGDNTDPMFLAVVAVICWAIYAAKVVWDRKAK